MSKSVKNILLLVSVIAIWKIASIYANPIFVPSPERVARDFSEVVQNGQIWKAIQYSFLRITVSTIISGLVALPIGLLIFNFSIFRDVLHPIVRVMRFIPVTAFYPLLIMWFGIDEVMKVVFLFIAMFVYMMPSVILSLEEVNQDLIDTGLTLGMNKMQTITRIQIPASLPSISSSFVMMFGIGWTYIAVVETINARYGLGYIIQQSSARGRTDLVFMAIIVIMIISILFDWGANKAIHTVFKWRYLDD